MGFGYQHFHPKNSPDPLKVKQKIFSNIGFLKLKEPALQHGFNESIGKSIRVCGADISFPSRSAKYRRFGLVQLFHSRFGGYLPAKLFLMGSSC